MIWFEESWEITAADWEFLVQYFKVKENTVTKEISIKVGLINDIVVALEDSLERIPDSCNCNAYREWDTGAWVHKEDVCQIFIREHIEITLKRLKEVINDGSG